VRGAILNEAKISLRYFNRALFDPRVEIDPGSECAPIVESMTTAVSLAVAAADTIMEVKRFKGEPYPLRARHTVPLPAKGELVIYGLIDPRDDTVFYVGQTNNYPTRLKAHLQFDGRYISKPNRVDRRKLELIVNGQPIIAAVLCCAADMYSAEYLESLAIRVFRSTVQNTQIVRGSLDPRYGRKA
jgi:hypothetical protein